MLPNVNRCFLEECTYFQLPLMASAGARVAMYKYDQQVTGDGVAVKGWFTFT